MGESGGGELLDIFTQSDKMIFFLREFFGLVSDRLKSRGGTAPERIGACRVVRVT